MRMKTWLAATIAALSLPFAAQATDIPADTAAAMSPRPLMWVIRDADTTLYLFGSIHVMKDGVPWLTPRIQQRFDSADTLWEELPNVDDTQALVAAAQPYLVNPANDMTAGLTPDEIVKLDTLLAPYGLASRRLMGVRKWAVGLILLQKQISALGFDSQQGVDVTLAHQARAAGKPIRGLETADQQMRFLVPANADEDLAALRDTLTDADDTPHLLNELLTAWEAGDETTLERDLIDKEKAENPVEYQRVIVERNVNWVPQIEAMLHEKGTAFVTVGTAHLIGPDSVISLLKKDGIVATKVD